MAFLHGEYRDGTVDIETGQAVSLEGITTFRFPKLAFIAEKTGRVASIGVLRHTDESVLPKPRTQRLLGAGLLSLGLAIGAVSQADHIGAFVMTPEAYLDKNVIAPIGRNVVEPVLNFVGDQI